MIGFAVKANKSADKKEVLDIATKDITTDVEEYEEETIEKEEDIYQKHDKGATEFNNSPNLIEQSSYDENNDLFESEQIHPDFEGYSNVIENYGNCLEPDKYCYFNSGISDFNFWYPDNSYNNISLDKNRDNHYGRVLKSIHFYGSNGLM